METMRKFGQSLKMRKHITGGDDRILLTLLSDGSDLTIFLQVRVSCYEGKV